MDRIEPIKLNGPRAYFTDFDHRLVTRTKNLSSLQLRAERKLKSLLLLKGQIVCAASHLATSFAYEFFKKNPILLTSKAIIPAFRSDKNEFGELFTRKRFKGRNDALKFYEEHVHLTVNWNLDDNSMWFRDRFLADLEDADSVLIRNLGQDANPVIEELTNEIREGALLGRDLVDRVSKHLPMQQKRLLQNYRELLYHMSGARVVNCESALPQENYIDYDLADLSQNRTRLTEEEILRKIMIELVFDSLQKELMPLDLLDNLSFNDIMLIRKPLLSSTFQKTYDQLVKQALSSTAQDSHVIYNVEELERIRKELALTFSSVIREQLPEFLKKEAFEQSKELGSTSASIALSVAGAVPGIGLVTSAASVMRDTPALLFNLGQTYTSVRSIKNLSHHYENKEKLIRKEVEELELKDKAVFFEMVDLLLNIISERIRF